jgi:hypothetical protein
VDAPAVYRPAVQEFLRRHHAVPLEDQAILHHKDDRSQRVDIFERIAFDCDEVRRKASFDRTALVIESVQAQKRIGSVACKLFCANVIVIRACLTQHLVQTFHHGGRTGDVIDG